MNKPNTSWRKGLAEALQANGESFEHLVGNTMSDAEMDVEFYDGYGAGGGCAFTVWTKDRVYFPAVYDGATWVANVPRNPCGEPTSHIGRG